MEKITDLIGKLSSEQLFALYKMFYYKIPKRPLMNSMELIEYLADMDYFELKSAIQQLETGSE